MTLPDLPPPPSTTLSHCFPGSALLIGLNTPVYKGIKRRNDSPIESHPHSPLINRKLPCTARPLLRLFQARAHGLVIRRGYSHNQRLLTLLPSTLFHYPMEVAHILAILQRVSSSISPSSLSRSLSDFESIASSSIRQASDGPSLHYLLDYDRTGRLIYDIRLPPNHSRPKLAQRLNIREAATAPAVQQMYIRIPGLPWVIDVRNPQGVTLENVLSTMFVTLQGVIAKEEYGMLSSQLANAASATFHTRARINPQAMSEGVKRVDCLGSKVLFLGITRAIDGSNTWNVRFSTDCS